MTKLTINGDERETEARSVGELLASIKVHPRTVVVEYNGELLSRGDYDLTTLQSGDQLEIVQMMAGG